MYETGTSDQKAIPHMLIQHVTRPDRVRRFFQTVQAEGWRSALDKTARFVLRLWRGTAPNAVPPAPNSADHQFYLGPFWQHAAETRSFHISTTHNRYRKVAMIGDLNLPQCRKYRVEQCDELFRLMQADYIYAHYQDAPRCATILQDATHLIVYRLPAGPELQMYLYEARRLGLSVLYDIDDPLFSVSAYGTYGNMAALDPKLRTHFMNEAPRYAEAMNAADLVSVSTPVMAEHARAYTPRPVFTRRNFADRDTLEAGHAAMRGVERDPNHFRVGFASGSHGHEMDFALIAEPLTHFLRANPTRQLVIMGHFDLAHLPKALHGQIERHAFTGYHDYLTKLASLDCAIMPLGDDLFNSCKSGVRVLDAAAVGVPSLVGTVSDMAHIVADGESGRVLGTPRDWGAALEDLARTPNLARQMGRAARAALETRWSARLGAPIIDPELIAWIRQ